MMRVTVKCKLNPDTIQKQILDETLDVCKDALNYVSRVAWDRKCFNRVALHHLVYYDIRQRFNLSAQIAVCVKDKVCFTYKADRSKQHSFNKPMLPLDPPRSMKLIMNSGEFASLVTLRGRQKIPLVLGEYQRNYLRDKARDICGSEVVKNGEYYLHLVIETDEPPTQNVTEAIGVDLGIKNLATTSDGEQFSGEQVERNRVRYDRLRSELQSKGTLSAKKHLKRVSGRERRFRRAVNHFISQRIVDSAASTGRGIVLEELKGIRQRTKVRKSQNGQHHKWTFGELIRFITYKAKLAGVPVYFADPKHTSQRCSHCGHTSKSNRKSQSEFVCQSCGFSTNAEYNAALNLSRAFVNTPNVLRPQGRWKDKLMALAVSS